MANVMIHYSSEAASSRVSTIEIYRRYKLEMRIEIDLKFLFLLSLMYDTTCEDCESGRYLN